MNPFCFRGTWPSKRKYNTAIASPYSYNLSDTTLVVYDAAIVLRERERELTTLVRLCGFDLKGQLTDAGRVQ